MTMKLELITLSAAAVLYAMFAFVFWDVDAGNWDFGARYLLAWLWFAVALVYGVARAEK